MLIKKIIKNGKIYYILLIIDIETKLWVCNFISEDRALALIDTGVKVIVKEV